MSGYGQFCPVAKAAELLDQRWMLLVVRELLAGSDRFNEIHRGVPRMSRSLLSDRLQQLVGEGLVRRRERDGVPHYTLTEAGRDLLPVIEALGWWGARWIDSLADDDLDPAFLLHDVQRGVDLDAVPPGTTVLEIVFSDLDPELGQWWLVLSDEEAEVCQEDHGFDVDVAIAAEIRPFIRLWRGDVGWDEALAGGELRLRGPTHLCRQVPDWLELSHFADVDRAPATAITAARG